MEKGHDINIFVGVTSGLILSICIVLFPQSPVFAVIAGAAIAMEAWHLKNIFGKQHAVRKLKLIVKNCNSLLIAEKKDIIDLSIYLKDEDLKEKLIKYACSNGELPSEKSLEDELTQHQDDSCLNVAFFIFTLIISLFILWIFRFPV